jgi:hypothetical protein
MRFANLWILGLALFFVSCSSSSAPKAKMATHEANRSIPTIDEMIVDMKKNYISKCYTPVAKRNPPENSCQTELFQLLERRYHSNYNLNHVSMASNELFFKDVEVQLKKMLRSNSEVRSAIKNGGFRNAEELVAYYKFKYAFETN